MLDRAAFLRPIAHRGLHNAARGVVENTPAAFTAAIAGGHGIECDLQASADGCAMVFHDASLERLVAAEGPVVARTAADLERLDFRGCADRMLRLEALLELVDGRVPLFVEIKSAWQPPDGTYLARIAALAAAYRGPLALMSFDPAVITAVRERAPGVPRGIVAGLYQGDGWWRASLADTRRHDLSNLLESGPAAPDFYAYHVADLPTPVTRYVREVAGLPILAWTVRTPADWAAARRHADAAIFEGPPEDQPPANSFS